MNILRQLDCRMTNKKLRVVWYCNVMTNSIQDYLSPSKRINDHAPWVYNLIPEFEKGSEIELHIVFMHQWINNTKHFDINGIFYHCFNPYKFIRYPKYFNRIDILFNYYWLNKRFAKIINNISPDIIHMHGFENQYSYALMQFKNKYPTIITICGFLSHSVIAGKVLKEKKKKINFINRFFGIIRLKYPNDLIYRMRIWKELEIISEFKNFGYRTKTMRNDLLSLNQKAKLLWHGYPVILNNIKPYNIKKKYDIVFFGRVCLDKGILDFLKAVKKIKEKRNNITACIIGDVFPSFVRLSEDLGLKDNIYWAGFQKSQTKAHILVSESKISVLPTYHDIIPGTIIESNLLEVPCVVYDVGSIHEINSKDKIVTLVKLYNINDLANSIEELLVNEEQRIKLGKLGRKRMLEMFDTNEKIKIDLYKIYSSIIEEFTNEK